MPWNPDQYDKFKAERSAPVDDLFKMIRIRSGMNVLDLGCGTGEYTRRLFDYLPGSTVLGIDSSPDMLAKSSAFMCDGCTTALEDIHQLQGQYDLIFSNAALQWCADHPSLLNQIWSHLNKGGQLVVQMPKNQDHISHLLASEVAHELYPQLFPIQTSQRAGWVLEPEEYAQILFNESAQNIVCFMKVYPHVMDNAAAVVEWVKGTLLIPFLEKLDEAQQKNFLEVYTTRLSTLMPTSPLLYAFKRILFSAVKA